MLKIVLVLAVTAASLQSQSDQDLLLRQKHILGLVVDQDGKPIVEACIDHTERMFSLHKTDSNGKFELNTRAPAVVVRKAGFQSERVLLKDSGAVTVTLRRLAENRKFPACPSKGKYYGLEGLFAEFRIPALREIKASRAGHDVDYVMRSYYLRNGSFRKRILHGTGGMWTNGMPDSEEVWLSKTYRETSYKFGDFEVMDAAGELLNGNHWRYLGTFGESMSYSAVDEATAKIFDRVFDGVCIKPKERLP